MTKEPLLVPYAERRVTKPTPPYRWKTSDGLHVQPCNMRTGHLFNTVAMIWHHRMPTDAKLFEHKRWNLMHSDEALVTALRHMIPELAKRDNLTPWQNVQVAKMMAYLRRPGLPSPLLQLEGL